jgi:hypothetical protein
MLQLRDSPLHLTTIVGTAVHIPAVSEQLLPAGGLISILANRIICPNKREHHSTSDPEGSRNSLSLNIPLARWLSHFIITKIESKCEQEYLSDSTIQNLVRDIKQGP